MRKVAVRTVEVRWTEHNLVKGNLEPLKHLQQNLNCKFTWKIVSSASFSTRKRRNHKVCITARRKPLLNYELHLF